MDSLQQSQQMVETIKLPKFSELLMTWLHRDFELKKRIEAMVEILLGDIYGAEDNDQQISETLRSLLEKHGVLHAEFAAMSPDQMANKLRQILERLPPRPTRAESLIAD